MTDSSKLNDTEFLEQLKASPVGREIYLTQNRELHEQRKMLVGRIEQIDIESGRDNSEYEKRAKSLFAQHEKLKRELIEVGRELNRASANHLARVSVRTLERSRIEQSLRVTAHPAIEQFVAYLSDLYEKSRGVMHTTPAGSESLLTGGRVRRFYSNAVHVKGWNKRVIEARRAAEAMLLAADQSGVEQNLSALRSSIPDADELPDEIVEIGPPIVRVEAKHARNSNMQ